MARRDAPFWQWHLKSVRAAQPSEERGPMKQVNCCRLVTVRDESKLGTYGALRDVVQLSRGNRGQSNDGGDCESLHVDDCSGDDTRSM